MYVFNFIVRQFSKFGKSASSICGSNQQDEQEPLVGRESEGYAAMGDEGRQRRRESMTQLGLTAEFKGWGESQQALHYCLGHLTVYLVLAVVGYSFIFEQWKVSDSIYFAVVIFTTVGYGDLSPSHDISRVFTLFFAFYGIVILGIFLGIIGETIIEKHEENVKERLANARVKVMEQFSEDDNATPPEDRSFLADVGRICWAEAPILLVLVLLGAPIIYYEEWDPIQGVYWMAITGTTVGFGDLGPTSVVTRCICVIWIPLAVAVLGEFLGRIAGTYIERRNDELEDSFLSRAMTLGDLRKMDENNDDKVSPNEFLRFMLVALQKVEKEEIDEIMELFHKLDKSNDGYIDRNDLMGQYHLNVRPGISVGAGQLNLMQ